MSGPGPANDPRRGRRPGEPAPAGAVLTHRGYDLVSAADGRTALELVECANPDLVLLERPDARDGRLRRVQEPALTRGHGGAARDHDHLEQRAGERRRRSMRAPTTSSRSRSTITSCSRAFVRSSVKRYHDAIKAQACRHRSRSSICSACDSSSHPSSPTRSWAAERSRPSAVIADRSSTPTERGRSG
jgi:hypothetical protein